jgi:thiamine kinase-like enzyme
MVHEINLNGHSNYKLSTYTYDDNVYVCKTCTSKEESDRLKAQRDKQNEFLSFIRDDEVLQCIFDVPKIVGESTYDNKFSFYMEYRSGLNIIEYIAHTGSSHYIKLFQDIFRLIEKETDRCKNDFVEMDAIKNKLEDITTKVSDNEIKKYIQTFSKKISKKKISIPMGFCHGDLTFSNMILSDKILLIDFLDDFINSPIQDICKLLQSVNLQWELLISKSSDLDILKLNIAYKFLRNELNQGINQYLKKHKINDEVLLILYTLTILRITPYVKSDKIMNAIKIELKRLEEKKCIHI